METHTFSSATSLLILVMDPWGNVPLCINLLRYCEPSRRHLVVIREILIAFAVLLFFVFFGEMFLDSLRLSDTALEIAGGVILFLIALRMVFPSTESAFGAQPHGEPFIVPLAIPLIAGPSTIATVLLLVSREPERTVEWIGALTVALLVSAVMLLFADNLAKLLGDKVMTAIERLMGLILTAMAVQMLLGGIEKFIQHIRV